MKKLLSLQKHSKLKIAHEHIKRTNFKILFGKFFIFKNSFLINFVS